MAGTIDMQMMRYINLFSKITRVQTRRVFVYNNQIIFAVPKDKVSFAIGKGAVNAKKISEILRKKVKIVEMPNVEDEEGIKKFITDVVSPIEFNGVEIKGDNCTINAGRYSKAALIGRGRIREKEIGDVLKDYFGIKFLRIA